MFQIWSMTVSPFFCHWEVQSQILTIGCFIYSQFLSSLVFCGGVRNPCLRKKIPVIDVTTKIMRITAKDFSPVAITSECLQCKTCFSFSFSFYVQGYFSMKFQSLTHTCHRWKELRQPSSKELRSKTCSSWYNFTSACWRLPFVQSYFDPRYLESCGRDIYIVWVHFLLFTFNDLVFYMFWPIKAFVSVVFRLMQLRHEDFLF